MLPPLLHVTSRKRVNDFEVNETTITAWDSWRTVDYIPLAKKINMIGIHQYRQICGRNEGLETVFACQKIGTVKTNHFRYQDMFKELWGFEPLGMVLCRTYAFPAYAKFAWQVFKTKPKI